MMQNNGGPAFPGQFVKHQPGDVGNNVAIHEYSSGMTLRDYFAGQALAGELASQAGGDNPSYQTRKQCENLAGWCYQMAEAMLAERAK